MREKWQNIIAPGLVIVGALIVFIWIAVFLISDGNATAAPVPGDPLTYTEKYQCPFYENVGPKGCIVPSNLTCNTDWSQCELKEDDPQPNSEPVVAPTASPAAVSPSTPVGKSCYE